MTLHCTRPTLPAAHSAALELNMQGYSTAVEPDERTRQYNVYILNANAAPALQKGRGAQSYRPKPQPRHNGRRRPAPRRQKFVWKFYHTIILWTALWLILWAIAKSR